MRYTLFITFFIYKQYEHSVLIVYMHVVFWAVFYTWSNLILTTTFEVDDFVYITRPNDTARKEQERS